MTQIQQYEKALAFCDVHRPWQDDKAIELTLTVADKLRPDKIIIDGDLSDFWEISRFDKSPIYKEKGRLVNEIDATREWLANLRKRFKRSEIIYIFGNHEYRWDVFLSNHAPELCGLRGLTLREQLDLDKNNIQCVYSGNKESSWLWGRLLIGHFDAVNQHSGYTAKNLLDRKGISIIQSHTHRGGTSYRRLWDRDIVAHEAFCLCNRDPEYVDHPNWQLGFLIIYKDRASDHFFVEPHPISDAENGALKVFFNGQCYQVPK